MARTTFNGDRSNPLAWILSLLLLIALAYLAVAYILGYKPFEKENLGNDSVRSSIRNEASSNFSEAKSSISSTVSSLANDGREVASSAGSFASSVGNAIGGAVSSTANNANSTVSSVNQ